MSKVYFDHAACELPIFEVKEFVKDALTLAYNPSAIYEQGNRNRQVIETVRKQIARQIHCKPTEIYFTSGATESNAWAIDGYLKAFPDAEAISTTIEHSSIHDNPNIQKLITVNHHGYVDEKNLARIAKTHNKENTLWVIQHGNNVIGSIQDIARLRTIIPNGRLFVDAAQTFGKIPIDVKKMQIDMLSGSARKIGGLGGVGFLYIKEDLTIKPLLYGAQENELRGGTYNEIGIGAFGVALENCSNKVQLAIRNRRDFFIEELLKIPQVRLIGTRSNRLPGIILISIKDVDLGSQQLVGLLDSMGYMVSTDSACHAGSTKFSHVLEGIGETEKTAKTVLRLSIGIENSPDQMLEFIKRLRGIIKMYKV